MNLLNTLHTCAYAITGGVKDRVDSFLARQQALAIAECKVQHLQSALSHQIAQNAELLSALAEERRPGPP